MSDDIASWITCLGAVVSLVGAIVVLRRLGRSATGVMLASGLCLHAAIEAGWLAFWHGFFIPASSEGLSPALQDTRLTAMLVSWLGYTVVALLLAIGALSLPRHLSRLRNRSAVTGAEGVFEEARQLQSSRPSAGSPSRRTRTR